MGYFPIAVTFLFINSFSELIQFLILVTDSSLVTSS